MNKVHVGEKDFDLVKDLVKKGEKLEFSVLDVKGNNFTFSPVSKLTIISTYPQINTSICDLQTKWITDMAKKYPNIDFISISTDSVETIKGWCANNAVDNVNIYSDINHDFGKASGTLVVSENILARSFIAYKNGSVDEVFINPGLDENPEFDKLEKYLEENK